MESKRPLTIGLTRTIRVHKAEIAIQPAPANLSLVAQIIEEKSSTARASGFGRIDVNTGTPTPQHKIVPTSREKPPPIPISKPAPNKANE